MIWNPNDGSGYTPAAYRTDMQIAHNKGQKIILSIGGASDLGIHMTTEPQVTQMVNSVNQIVADYGFDGIDWDLEKVNNITAATFSRPANNLGLGGEPTSSSLPRPPLMPQFIKCLPSSMAAALICLACSFMITRRLIQNELLV